MEPSQPLQCICIHVERNNLSNIFLNVIICRLCHGIGVNHGASKTGDAVTGAVSKFRHRTEPHTLTAVSRVQTGISTYSFHPVELNSFTQLYRFFFPKYCRVVIYSELTRVTIVSQCDTTEYGSASRACILTFVSLSLPSHPTSRNKVSYHSKYSKLTNTL